MHKIQGSEAGFGMNDEIRYIIANIDTLDWEKRCPGTAYVVASRAKTIGQVTSDNPYPTDSNLFLKDPWESTGLQTVCTKIVEKSV